MGWWETTSSNWSMAIVAQMGGVVGGGAGAFFVQLKSPDVPVKPLFLNVALAYGIGGSVGSAITIPWSAVVRQLINPRASLDLDAAIFTSLDGSFSCKDISHKRMSIAQAQASAIFVGASMSYVRCYESGDQEDWTPDTVYFTSHINVPKTLRQVGNAVIDLPQIQGGFGVIAAMFVGVPFYIGTS